MTQGLIRRRKILSFVLESILQTEFGMLSSDLLQSRFLLSMAIERFDDNGNDE